MKSPNMFALADSIRAPRSSRRGILTMWMVWIMLVAGLIVAGLFNVLWTSGIRSEARRCAEASALAAGHAYLSDDLLRSQQAGFESQGRAARALAAASGICGEYGRLMPMLAQCGHDVRLIASHTASKQMPQSEGVPAGIEVLMGHPGERSWIPLLFSGFANASGVPMAAGACVALEHTPVGFRAGPGVPVPMLPFAIQDMEGSGDSPADPGSPGYWTRNVESSNGRDDVSWNPEQRCFENGPDGIPEVTVRLGIQGIESEDALIPIAFPTGRPASGSAVAEWIRSGLTAERMPKGRETQVLTAGVSNATQLSYPGTLPVCPLNRLELARAIGALNGLIGEPRILSLYTIDETTESGHVRILRPVAARIARIESAAGQSVRLTLQPCVLITSTALTDPSGTSVPNRYIYSVRLCR